ncbi:SDR family oxidoreductase [Kribbella yunnanensis]|uniref:SDR family oxidoreductase n=1 Tax=Kribbella yunnanensis TaxID=190194 RepID=A0ABP4UW51_9ACTN
MKSVAGDENGRSEVSESAPSWALVTGSSNGIGRAAALGLAADGYSVVVTGRSAQRVEEVRGQIEGAGGRAIGLVADLSGPSAARGLAEQVRDAVDGPVDVLVNNAGGGSFAPTEATSDEMFDVAFNLNAKAPFILVGAFAPGMAERGRGAIINVGSLSSTMATAGTAAFQAAKGALSMMTKSWTAEYGPRGVRVNTVDPGFVLTAVNEDFRPAFANYLSTLPAGRGGDPEEVGNAIRFLASPQASYIYGVTLAVDGGRNAVVPF